MNVTLLTWPHHSFVAHLRESKNCEQECRISLGLCCALSFFGLPFALAWSVFLCYYLILLSVLWIRDILVRIRIWMRIREAQKRSGSECGSGTLVKSHKEVTKQ